MYTFAKAHPSPDCPDLPRRQEWLYLGPNLIHLRCPRCAQVFSLRRHHVDLAGNVAPSVVCPWADCGFHETIVLADWGTL